MECGAVAMGGGEEAKAFLLAIRALECLLVDGHPVVKQIMTRYLKEKMEFGAFRIIVADFLQHCASSLHQRRRLLEKLSAVHKVNGQDKKDEVPDKEKVRLAVSHLSYCSFSLFLLHYLVSCCLTIPLSAPNPQYLNASVSPASE